MRAAVYHGPADVRVETLPDPAPQAEEDAVVRASTAAVCGSDLHLWHGLPLPERGFAIGHECVGRVEAVGPGVRRVRPGDRVAVSCTLGCGRCDPCRRGLAGACTATTAGGTRSNVLGFSAAWPGAQAEAVRVPFADHNCLPLPESLDDERALFLADALPTADLACELAGVGPGDVVVVFGAGTVGRLAQRCAWLRGAARVVAVDPDPARLAAARDEGCDPVDPEREDPAERVAGWTGGRGADAAIEAVGRPELPGEAARTLGPGGRLAVVGVVLAPVELPWPLFFARSLGLRTGLVSPQRHAAHLTALLERGRLDPRDLVSHRWPLERAPEAYRMLAAHRDGAVKVLLRP